MPLEYPPLAQAKPAKDAGVQVVTICRNHHQNATGADRGDDVAQNILHARTVGELGCPALAADGSTDFATSIVGQF